MSPKWVDNALSRHPVPGTSKKSQGVTRRLPPNAVTTLEIALRLGRLLSVPLARGLDLAQLALENGDGTATLELSTAISIVMDVAAITSETAARLAEAVEIAPVPRRGRPRTYKKEGRLSAPLLIELA